MSRTTTTNSTRSRTVAFAGIAFTAILAAPAAAQVHSITSERMLLNHPSPIATPDQRSTTAPGDAARAETDDRIDATAALLGRTTDRTGRPFDWGTIETLALPETRIDGERSLLGYVARSKPRQEGDE
jgi:hypothetical protein